MSYHRARFWYQGKAEVSFAYYDGYLINFPSGVGQLDATRTTIRSPDGIGVSCQLESLPERNITINGYVMGYPSADYRRELERAFAPLSPGRLWAETEDHELFFLDCVSAGTPVIEGTRKNPRFQVGLTADYPFWQRDTYQELILMLTEAAEEFQREIVSDVPTLFSLALTASDGCQGAALVVGGQELRYDDPIGAGQTLFIQIDQTGRAECTLGGQSVVGKLSGGLKKLPVGMQTIRLEAPGNSGTVTANIKYREARAGV